MSDISTPEHPHQQYPFSWDLLGDIQLGRPNLGSYTRIEVYRLMQFTLRDVIEKHFGKQAVDKIFYCKVAIIEKVLKFGEMKRRQAKTARPAGYNHVFLLPANVRGRVWNNLPRL